MFSKAIEAGRAYVRVFADTKEFAKGISGITARMNKAAVQMARVGAVATTMGLAMAAAMRPAVGIAAEFSAEMSTVKAVTGAAGEQFTQLTKQARELGASTSFSASQAAQGMKFLGMAGFETRQILAGIPAVLNLAKAGAVELSVAADIASDVSSAFSLSAEEISRVADVMAKAAASANVSIEGLGESFKFAAPAGKAAGQTIEEVTAALGTLGSSGLKGSMAGRNLMIIFKQLASADVQQKLKDLGVAVQDIDGNFRDLSDIIRDLRRPLSEVTEVERVRLLGEVFGESAKAAQILVSNSTGFDLLRSKLFAAEGAAAQMAATMGDNLAGDVAQMKSAAEELALSFADGVTPALREATQTFTGLLRETGQFLKDNPQLSVGALKLAAGLVAVGGATTALAAVTKSVSLMVGQLTTLQAVGLPALGKLRSMVSSPLGRVALGAAMVGIAVAVADARQAFAEFNKELERSGKLSGKLLSRDQKQYAAVFDRISQTQGQSSERRVAAIDKEIADLEKNLAGQQGQVASIDREFGRRNFVQGAYDSLGLDADADLMRENRRAAQARVDAISDTLAELRKIREEAKRSTETPATETGREQGPPDELQRFADQVRRDLVTEEQQLQVTLSQLDQAFRAELITLEEFTAATEKATEAQREKEAEDRRQRQLAADERRNNRLDRFLGRFGQDLKVFRGNDDIKTEIKALRAASKTLWKAGFKDAAVDLKIEEINTIQDARRQAEDNYNDSLSRADMVTASALEASVGLGRESVDVQSLRQLEAMNSALERANTELERMNENLED